MVFLIDNDAEKGCVTFQAWAINSEDLQYDTREWVVLRGVRALGQAEQQAGEHAEV